MQTSNTPLPASEFRRLADEMADAIEGRIADGSEECQRMEYAVRDYRAARLASPVTLEEALMAGSCRAYNDYIFARDLPGNGDPEELLAKYNTAHRAQAEHAATLSVTAYERESDNARRLAREGGAA